MKQSPMVFKLNTFGVFRTIISGSILLALGLFGSGGIIYGLLTEVPQKTFVLIFPILLSLLFIALGYIGFSMIVAGARSGITIYPDGTFIAKQLKPETGLRWETKKVQLTAVASGYKVTYSLFGFRVTELIFTLLDGRIERIDLLIFRKADLVNILRERQTV